MTEALITCSIENALARITIDNPPLNPLTTELRDELLAGFDALYSRKDAIRAVVLTGKGEAFMAGADIKSFPELTQEKAKARLKESRQLYLSIEQFERPVICAING
jgi:enoyl-CoA hydratase